MVIGVGSHRGGGGDDLDDLRHGAVRVSGGHPAGLGGHGGLLVLLLHHLDLVHAHDGDGAHRQDGHRVGRQLDDLPLHLHRVGAVRGRRQHGVVLGRRAGLAVPEVEAHLDAAEEEAADVGVLNRYNRETSPALFSYHYIYMDQLPLYYIIDQLP
jgi:hypothetical protein